jgi:hypothetical protein
MIIEDLASATDAPFRRLKDDLDAELRRKFGVEESCRGTSPARAFLADTPEFPPDLIERSTPGTLVCLGQALGKRGYLLRVADHATPSRATSMA